MNRIIARTLFVGVLCAALLFSTQNTLAQNTGGNDSLASISDTIHPAVLDSLSRLEVEKIEFNDEEAIAYISEWYNNRALWKDLEDPLRRTMGRFLYEATNDQFYISERFLGNFNWESIKIPASSFYLWDTLHILLPENGVLGTHIADIIYAKDSLIIPDSLSISRHDGAVRVDTLFTENDTLDYSVQSDTIFEIDKIVIPDSIINIRDSVKTINADIIRERRDSIILVISDTLRDVISANMNFPFASYNYPMVGDSIQAAMDVLQEYTALKDSTEVHFIGSGNSVPVWLSNNPNTMMRLRLKNERGEEVSVWIGSSYRDSVSVIVEEGVHFRRPNRETNFAKAKVDVKLIDNSKLADARKIDFKPRYWKFLSETSFVFNQVMIKNWSKGGESNISTLIDLTGTVDYTNKEEKMTWNTIGRFKYGLQMSGEFGVRKNIDVIDIGSKFNNKAFGKFDFSATMIFKTQLAKGYNYPNDSVVISKFFNPATIIVGLGLEYKPNKNMSINFAPLSYKGTFVPDTLHIDQTKHGLSSDQRSKHEPGISAQVNHKTVLWKKVNVSNRVRLFTNYIHNPQNIDIDWEMIATTKLNWFTDIRINTHLLYDDDTLIPVFNKDDEPVMGSDGNQKRVPKVQFKELIGVSVIFRF